MSEHILHDPIYEGGLVDDCPGCGRLASDPLHLLDNRNAEYYVQRTINWLVDEGDPQFRPRSTTERSAMLRLERLFRDIRRANEKGFLPDIVGYTFKKG